MKVLHMCDYCEHEFPTCEAKEIAFGIDLNVVLETPILNDAVVGCDKFYDNGNRKVVFIKI